MKSISKKASFFFLHNKCFRIQGNLCFFTLSHTNPFFPTKFVDEEGDENDGDDIVDDNERECERKSEPKP